MDDKRIEEIGARCNAATPGPWTPVSRGAAEGEDGCFGWELNEPPDAGIRGWVYRWADIDFIAHARADVPDLLVEVRRLREENERLHCCGNCKHYQRDEHHNPLVDVPMRCQLTGEAMDGDDDCDDWEEHDD